MMATVGITCGVRADEFQWLEVTNSAVKNLLQPNANSYLPYFAVANAGSDGGFMCVGSNFIASLATTNTPLTTTNGGYLLETNGWVNVIANSYTNVYLNCVTYGSGMFVAAGKTNVTFAFAPGQGWSQPKNANIKASYDAKGIAYNPISKTFALVTSSLKAAYAGDTNWAPGNSLAWKPANTVNSAVVESFRGVTSMGGSSFALCGIYEDMRLSTDGGSNWVQNRIINLSTPTNLLAIASDGAQTLVAVGEHNALLVSVNTGTNWSITTLSNAVSDSVFNAVTYTGPDDKHFIVVGTGGQIYSCTNDPAVIVNGVNWTKITNGLTASATNNLLGVSYAASGPFQGIGMAVGNNGTILIGGTPPPAPANTNSQVTNILGVAYQTLLPTIETNTLHPAVSTTIDWYTDKVGGTLLASGQVAFTPTNINCGIYTNYAEARDARTGLGNTNRTGFVFYVIPPAPTSTTGWTNLLTQPVQINPLLLASVFTDNDNPFNYFQVQWFTEPNELSLITNLSETTNFNQFGYRPDNALCGTYTNWARTIAVTTSPPGIPNLVSTNWTPVVFTVIPPAPTNAVAVSAMTNILTGSPQINKALGVDLLVNASNPPSNFVVDWYSNPTGPALLNNGSEFNSGNQFYHTPSTYKTCGIYTNWAETRATNTFPSGTDVVSTNRTSVTFVIVPQQPVNPIGWTNVLTAPNQINAYLCVDVVTNLDNPASAFTVDWFADSGATIPLLNGSEINVGTQFCFIPTNNVCGTYTVFARTRAVTTTPSGISLVSTGMTQVVFRLIPPAPLNPQDAINCAYNGNFFSCPNPPVSVDLFTNAVNPASKFTASFFTASNGVVPFTNIMSAIGSTVLFYPTNALPSTNNIWVETMDLASGLVSTNRTMVTFTVYPVPGVPTTFGATNCADAPTNSGLKASFTLGATNSISQGPVVVDWYANPTNGLPLATNAWTFYPTNTLVPLDDNHASNYVFYAQARVIDLTLMNSCECRSTNRVPVVLRINPVPGAVLIQANDTICNGGTATAGSVLTGIGPWTVVWSDSYNNTYTQTITNQGAGPFTNLFTLPLNVFNLTNAFLSQATNYSFAIYSVSNDNTCLTTPVGQNFIVTVDPRPTAYVSGSTNFSVAGTNVVTANIQADLTGLTGSGPWTVVWSDGVTNITASSPVIRTIVTNLPPQVTYTTNYFYQRYNKPYNNNNSSNGLPNFITNILTSVLVTNGNPNYNHHANQWQFYPTNILYNSSGRYYNYFCIQTNIVSFTNSLSEALVFTVTNLSDATACAAQTNDLNGQAVISLSADASAVVSFATLTGGTNICSGVSNSVTVTVSLSGTPPWTNQWSDGTMVVTNISNYSFSITPTNMGWFYYSITNFSDANGSSTNISGGVAVYVNALPDGVPISNGDQTNCAGVVNPALSVTDTNIGITINWHDSFGGLVASVTNLPGTNVYTYIPDDTDPGAWTYYAAEVNVSGCEGPAVPVTLWLLDCSSPPSIQFNGTNGSVQWFGNLTLQSTTNLAPAVWVNVTNGGLGTNTWIWTNGVSPQNFFRLDTNNVP